MTATKSTHTPGPWAVHIDGVAVFGAGPKRQQVVDCETGSSPNLSQDEREANARLIAAAPDLLKAAHAAYHALQRYAYGNASPDLARSCAVLLDDVIAKAEG